MIERCASAFLARDKPEESMVSVVRNVNHRSLIASDYQTTRLAEFCSDRGGKSDEAIFL